MFIPIALSVWKINLFLQLVFLETLRKLEGNSEERQLKRMRIGRLIFEYLPIFLIGAVTYNLIEILFRGYTHWTMALAGGVCMASLCYAFGRMQGAAWWKKCLIGSVVITLVEFITGCIVNLWLDWGVWDYSHLPLQFLGQICLFFSIFWFILCVPVIWISSAFWRIKERDIS